MVHQLLERLVVVIFFTKFQIDWLIAYSIKVVGLVVKQWYDDSDFTSMPKYLFLLLSVTVVHN